jgi:hypothetical protein
MLSPNLSTYCSTVLRAAACLPLAPVYLPQRILSALAAPGGGVTGKAYLDTASDRAPPLAALPLVGVDVTPVEADTKAPAGWRFTVRLTRAGLGSVGLDNNLSAVARLLAVYVFSEVEPEDITAPTVPLGPIGERLCGLLHGRVMEAMADMRAAVADTRAAT